MMEQPNDRPRVVVFPPLIMASALLSALALQYLWPLPIATRPAAIALGSILCMTGIATVAWGRITLMKAGTNVSPLKPTTAVVTKGPFRFTRNPLYVGGSALIVGLSLVLGTWWGAIMIAPHLVALHRGVVIPEEAYLESKFGDVYRNYKAAVRRYV